MGPPVRSPLIYRFGLFEADLSNRELRKHGVRVRLQEKPFQVLTELLRRPGEVVTREELRQRLWSPGTFVDFDEGVNTAVKRLRVTLGDSSASPLYIETVSRYGYRFIAPVTPVFANDKPVPESRLAGVPAETLPGPVAGEQQKPSLSKPLLWFALAFGLTTLVGVAIYEKWGHATDRASTAIQSIAVLPLENLSADVSQEFFAEGITEEITTELAKMAGPKVMSRTSAMRYRGTQKKSSEIARDLNVDAIVEGSVERSADRVRVRVQLIQASTDRNLWAEEYDRQLSDVLQLEADVAQDIARQIQTELTPQQKGTLARNRTSNPQAFQDYLLGRHYWALRTKESLNKSVEYFNRAIEEDPNDARSYAGLAHSYIVMPMLTGMPAAEALAKAQLAAAKAVELDASLADAHLAIAESLLYHDWDFAGAEKEFRKTLDLNPNYSTGHQWYGEFLSLMGRHAEAIREQRAALALDPLSAIIHHQAAATMRDAGLYDEAIKQYQEALKISPEFLAAYEAMYWTLRRQGRFVESIHPLQMAIAALVADDNPAIAAAVNELRPAYARAGRTGYFLQCLKVHRYYARPHFYLARDYAELGDRDAALAALARSYEDHDIEALWLLTDPELDSLRADARFQRLIRAVRFPH